MTYSSSEKEFYQRHYRGALQIAANITPEATRNAHFAPGKRYHLLLSELDKNRKYKTAVEIGCAGGDCIAYLAREFDFTEAIGIDIAFPDEMRQQVDGVRFVQSNSNERLPLPDGSVDVYVAMMVIEHLFDPFHAFEEIKRVLAPGGKAFVNLPLVTSIKNRMRLLFGRLPETSVPFARWLEDKEWDGNHLHYFSLDAIKHLSSRYHLEVTKVAGVGSCHQLKTMLPRLLANELSFVVEHSS